MHQRLRVKIKVETRSTSRLNETLYIVPLFYLHDYNLRSLICGAKKRVSGNPP